MLVLHADIMKTQGWYKVIKDEEYFKEFLGIFSEFHDYRITHIECDFEKNHLMLYLRYDTDEEEAVLKFVNVKDMHICSCGDYEVSWLFGSGLKMSPSYSLFWYNVDDEDNIDEIKKDKNLTWIESEQIIFAWLDKDNQVALLTDEQLNSVWRILNYETGKYESVQKHFRVFAL